jgi:DnaJ-class molecular chaperone
MNYYEILGLNRNCTLEDIKKSYKKLCLIYHPDISKEDPKKFLEIKEAYDNLIRTHKENGSYEKMWSDLFKTISKKNLTHSITLNVSLEEIVNNYFEKELNIFFDVPCTSCTLFTRISCNTCRGLGFIKEYKLSKICFENISQQDQVFIFKTFHKNIDLRVKLHIVTPPQFKLRGRITESIENIDIFKAIVGGNYKVTTINGLENVILPEGKIKDFDIILENKGIFGGNHLIKLKVFLSKNLTDEQKKILNILAYGKN